MTANEPTGRATVRPVTLGRLVETAYVCAEGNHETADIESALDVTHRRARETILEALRIGLIEQLEDSDPEAYTTSSVGTRFLDHVTSENWTAVSDLLEERSPHYRAFLRALDAVDPASLSDVLAELDRREASTGRSYNQTSIEVLGSWGERLETIQRNAFTGTYYLVEESTVPTRFGEAFLAVYDDLEETAGIDLRQRYLSIPEVREYTCERYRCERGAFDSALRTLARQNVGRLELSGAPMDTGAKEARLGIKEISLDGTDELVTTTQSTDRVMAGIDQYGKTYYYVAVHDRELTFDSQEVRP